MPPTRKKPAGKPQPTSKAKGERPAASASDRALGWVLALADRVDGGTAAPRFDPAWLERDRIALAIDRFGLDEVERALLVLLATAERSFAASRRLRALAGGPRITVELARELIAASGLPGLVERLAPGDRLRAHALVHVDGAEAERRPAAASDALRIEVGLVPAMHPRSELAVQEIAPEPAGGEPEPFVQRLGGSIPQLALVESIAAGGELAAARALATGLGRKVLCWRARNATPGAIARLRREVDLDGTVLLVIGPSEHGGALVEALTQRPPARPAAPPLVVCAHLAIDEASVRAPFILRREKTLAPAYASSDGSIDYVRQLAQRDADRALGIVRPAPPPPRPVVPGRIVDASVRVPEPTPSPIPSLSPTPTPSPSPTPSPTPSPSAVSRQPSADAVSRQPSADAAPPIADLVPGAEDGPRLEVPPNAPIDVRARAAMQSPSAAQRIELLESLAGLKNNAVVKALRHNAASQHVGVRQVAESMMTRLFGAAWNRTRAIAPPAQPPSTDDDGRGPAGA